jgi:hypothetical protein
VLIVWNGMDRRNKRSFGIAISFERYDTIRYDTASNPHCTYDTFTHVSRIKWQQANIRGKIGSVFLFFLISRDISLGTNCLETGRHPHMIHVDGLNDVELPAGNYNGSN